MGGGLAGAGGGLGSETVAAAGKMGPSGAGVMDAAAAVEKTELGFGSGSCQVPVAAAVSWNERRGGGVGKDVIFISRRRFSSSSW